MGNRVVKGYKTVAFELYEQFGDRGPDFIACPPPPAGTSGGFQGVPGAQTARLMGTVPRMIIVQAANNSPLVTAHRQGLRQPVPFAGFHTVAEAITSGNPWAAMKS
jgi:threonine synthase